MDHESTALRSRIAHLSLGGGFLISAVGSCVGQVGVAAGETSEGVVLGLVSLCIGVPLMLVGNAARLRAVDEKLAANELAAEELAIWNAATSAPAPTPPMLFTAPTEEFPGGGFDISMETDPSLDLQITVVTGPPLRAPEPVEEWVVVAAGSALFGPAEVGVA